MIVHGYSLRKHGIERNLPFPKVNLALALRHQIEFDTFPFLFSQSIFRKLTSIIPGKKDSSNLLPAYKIPLALCPIDFEA